MLVLSVSPKEIFDERENSFICLDGLTLCLEHSLFAISKWEAFYEKPFLTRESKTLPELLKYIQCMTLNDEYIPDAIYQNFSKAELSTISDYMAKKMTASQIKNSNPSHYQITTSEIIYARMFLLGIPMECDKWNINRLLTLIHVCQAEASPRKPMSKEKILAQNSAINKARLAKYHTKG